LAEETSGHRITFWVTAIRIPRSGICLKCSIGLCGIKFFYLVMIFRERYIAATAQSLESLCGASCEHRH